MKIYIRLFEEGKFEEGKRVAGLALYVWLKRCAIEGEPAVFPFGVSVHC
jgi:hypothetical protein